MSGFDRRKRDGEDGGVAQTHAHRAPGKGSQSGGAPARTTRDLVAPSVPAPTPSTGAAPGATLRSSDPRLNGRSVVDASRELKAVLLTFARASNRMIEGLLALKHELIRDRRSDITGLTHFFTEDVYGDHRDDPHNIDPLLPEWEALVSTIVADVHTPEDATHIHTLATRVLADDESFRALAARTSAVSTGALEHARDEMDFLRHTLTVVNVTKDVGLASGVLAAAIVAAPAGAVYGVLGEVGAGSLGGALVGAGLRAGDATDPRPMHTRMIEGASEGALAGPAALAGQQAATVVQTLGEEYLGESAAAKTVTTAASGAADASVSTGTFTTGASLVRGDSLATALRNGLTAAAIAAPFGALAALATESVFGTNRGASAISAAAEDVEIKPLARDLVPERLAQHQQEGAVVKSAGRDATTGGRVYDLEYPDGRRVRIVEQQATPRPGADGTVPTPEQAAEARASADRAAEIQARRDAQLTALVTDHEGPVVVDTAIMGDGQSGTLAHATARDVTGAPPGIDVTEIPAVINIAPEGSMFARHGDFPIGQTPPELRGPSEAHQPGEYTHDHGAPITAKNYVRSLTTTGYESGMATYRATVTEVEVRPAAGWGEGVPAAAQDMPVRITAGGKTIYVRRFIAAGGLGTPKTLSKVGTPFGAHEAELAASGRLVYAQDSLTLPGGGRKVIVVGGGATGAWACEAAIKQQATKVYWIGRPDPGAAVPPAVRAEIEGLGVTSDQMQAFVNGYNRRNASTFRYIESGQIEQRVGAIGDVGLDPQTKEVTVTLADGSKISGDGVVVAIGQDLSVPKGVGDRAVMQFRMVTVNYGGKERVVALDAFDPVDGHPMGIQIRGAQMTKAGQLVVDSERKRFEQLVYEQAMDPSVPSDSRGVPGSIYQTNIDAPLAPEGAPSERGMPR